MSDYRPIEWLCAALSQLGTAESFKIVKFDSYINANGQHVDCIRVLHKESGAVWWFMCNVEREGVA